MSNASRRSSVIVLGLALLLGATALHADHSWGNYHWARTSNPFTLKLGDNVTSAWDSYLNTASNQWSQSSVLNTTVVAGSTRPKPCKGVNGRIEVCNAAYGGTGWLGIAQISITGGEHIVKGVAKMNDSYFNTSTYNTPDWRAMVMCQEIAHAFGLDHQDENFNNANLGSCMDYTSDPNGPPSNTSPNAHDYDQLETIYAHLDSTTTVGLTAGAVDKSMPPAMDDLELNGLGQWGRPIGKNLDGRSDLYVLDFGDGYMIFTHVIWADAALGYDDEGDHGHHHGGE